MKRTKFDSLSYFAFMTVDPPRKRIDTRNLNTGPGGKNKGTNGTSFENMVLAEGSPVAPRRYPYGYASNFYTVASRTVLDLIILTACNKHHVTRFNWWSHSGATNSM